jgi:hypothetical protein
MEGMGPNTAHHAVSDRERVSVAEPNSVERVKDQHISHHRDCSGVSIAAKVGERDPFPIHRTVD